MRVINRKEFLQMRKNTIFATYEPCVFGRLCIKGESFEDDFLFTDFMETGLNFNIYSDLLDNRKSVLIDLSSQSRDGIFEDEQMFVIFEDKDIEHLIDRLKMCL